MTDTFQIKDIAVSLTPAWHTWQNEFGSFDRVFQREDYCGFLIQTADGLIWAPEVHCYRGKYYLFATINSDIVWKKEQKGWPPYIWRGTQIFRSNSPEGPFVPFSGDRHTPADEMALDGTLWVEDGIPYMIYCHEWVQIADGSIKLVELSSDLSGLIRIYPAIYPKKTDNRR